MPSKHQDSSNKLQIENIEDHKKWPKLSQIKMSFSAEVGLPNLRVRDLLELAAGHVIESTWKESEDVLIKTAKVHIGWGEFEVQNQTLLIRMTRLA